MRRRSEKFTMEPVKRLHCDYNVKVKQSLYGPIGLQMVEDTIFLDSQLMRLVRLPALRTGRLYSLPRKYLCYSGYNAFRLIKPLERTMN
jgi:hypothetical protein